MGPGLPTLLGVEKSKSLLGVVTVTLSVRSPSAVCLGQGSLLSQASTSTPAALEGWGLGVTLLRVVPHLTTKALESIQGSRTTV